MDSGASGGASDSGGGSDSGDSGGTGGAGETSDAVCGDAVDMTDLVAGSWKNRSPSAVGFTDTFGGSQVFPQGIASAQSQPSRIYVAVSAYPGTGALCMSRDSGLHWRQVSPLDAPLDVKVDPANPKHVYAAQGVNGNAALYYGFWEATDAEDLATWVHHHFPVAPEDAYHIAVDPTNFSHVLVSFHYRWANPVDYDDAGVVESFNGGATWTVHAPIAGTGYGHTIHFLYDPANNIGNSQTWLLGTQSDGFWKTTDSGSNWTHVATGDAFNQSHGGAEIYYAADHSVLVGGYYSLLRSTDNGSSWSQVPNMRSAQYYAVTGDGVRMFAEGAWGGRTATALESGPNDWSDYSTQVLPGGTFDFAWDMPARTVYASIWITGGGVWALKTQ